MKSKVYTSSLAKRIILALGLVVLPLSVVSQTHASGAGSILGQPTIAVVSVDSHPGMSIKNAAELKARLLHLILRNAKLNPKSVRVLAKGCGCAVVAQEDANGFGSCMRGCLQDAGASYYGVILCGGTCGLGAIPICALCLGLTITAVEVCAIGCAAYPGPFHPKGFMGRGIKPRHATSGSLQAKLRLQPAKGKS
jgi:hypothetical protein